MSEAFDPYYKWLGIPPTEQPPNHYRLLGVTLFEADLDVIGNAADQRMAHVRTFQAGRHSELSQRILNEIAAARVCLLNAEKKAEYDRTLQQQAAAAQPSAPAWSPRPDAQGGAPQFPSTALFPAVPPPVVSFGAAVPPPLPLGPTPVPPTVESMMPAGAMPELTAPPVAWVDDSAPHYHARRKKAAWPGPAIFAGLLAVGGVAAWLIWQKGLVEDPGRPTPGAVAVAPAVPAPVEPAVPTDKPGRTIAAPQAPPQTDPKKPKEPATKPPVPSKPAAVVAPSPPPTPTVAKPTPTKPAPLKPEPPKPATSGEGTAQTPVRPAFGMPGKGPVPDADARKAAEAKLAATLSDGSPAALREAAQDANRAPAERFVLLAKALDLSVAAGDVVTAMELIGEKARQFEIEAVTEKAKTLTAMREGATTPATCGALAEQVLALVDQPDNALPRDQLRQLTEIAIGAARKSGDAELAKRATLRFLKLREPPE